MVVWFIASIVGVCFGMLLALSGITAPQVILQQLQGRSYLVLKTILVIVSCISIVLAVLNYLNMLYIEYVPLPLNIILISGCCFGLGMALTKSLPLLLPVQIGLGYYHGWLIMVGIVAGIYSANYLLPLIKQLPYGSSPLFTASLLIPFWFSAIVFAAILLLLVLALNLFECYYYHE